MTITPDPKTVREIAKSAMGYALRQCRDAAVEAALLAGTTAPVLGREFVELTRAVVAEYDRLTAALSWPDEQPQYGGPLTLTELVELTASIDHLSGPDAFDEDQLEPALIPVTHYVPRLLAMVAKRQVQNERDAGNVKSKTCAHCGRNLVGASIHTIQGVDVCADIRHCLARQAEQRKAPQDERDGDVRAVAEAVVRLQRWLTGRQAHVHSKVSTTSVIAEPRDRSTAAWAIAESDVRAVVAALDARDAKAAVRERIAELAEFAEEER